MKKTIGEGRESVKHPLVCPLRKWYDIGVI
jgi:hypothetical protein